MIQSKIRTAKFHRVQTVESYKDFNAWQDIEFATPKTLNSKLFKSYLTVYIDDGDRMVPSGSVSLTCAVKKNEFSCGRIGL